MENINNINIEFIFLKIYDLFAGHLLSGPIFSSRTVLIFKIISILISWSLMMVLATLASKLWKLRQAQTHHMLKKLSERQEMAGVLNQRWEEILRLTGSTSEADWIRAIIEADKILDEVVMSMQLPGDSLGERMKNIEVADFPVLQDAWDAHKVRNRIAHEPGFKLSDREVGRVIGLYGKVFRSVGYI